MSDIEITYKGNTIAEVNASGTKKLLTKGKYCEDDIEIEYVKPGGGDTPTGTKQISITQNGTTTHDVTDYATAEIITNVSGGGGSGIIIDSGTFTLESRTQGGSVIINHNLGVVPQIVIIQAPNYETEIETSGSNVVYGIYNSINSSVCDHGAMMACGYYANASATGPSFGYLNGSNAGRTAFEASLSATQFCGIFYTNTYQYAAGVTYKWTAIAGIQTS